jgi:ribonuclease HI
MDEEEVAATRRRFDFSYVGPQCRSCMHPLPMVCCQYALCYVRWFGPSRHFACDDSREETRSCVVEVASFHVWLQTICPPFDIEPCYNVKVTSFHMLFQTTYPLSYEEPGYYVYIRINTSRAHVFRPLTHFVLTARFGRMWRKVSDYSSLHFCSPPSCATPDTRCEHRNRLNSQWCVYPRVIGDMSSTFIACIVAIFIAYIVAVFPKQYITKLFGQPNRTTTTKDRPITSTRRPISPYSSEINRFILLLETVREHHSQRTRRSVIISCLTSNTTHPHTLRLLTNLGNDYECYGLQHEWRMSTLSARICLMRYGLKHARTSRPYWEQTLISMIRHRISAAQTKPNSEQCASTAPSPHAPSLWTNTRRIVTRTTHYISTRLRTLMRKWICWLSGEAYIPGPTHTPRKPYKPHVNDVRYRFHNVQGLNDSRFREYYLRTASQHCEVLALAETNCPGDAESATWEKDWPRNGGTFWAHSHHHPTRGPTARGMAILLSARLGHTDASVIWRDPLGRGLAIRANIHTVPTVIVAFHADTGAERQHAHSYHVLYECVPKLPNHDYVWLLDANNVADPTLDSERSDRAPNSQEHPLGVDALHECACKWGEDGDPLQDAFRLLYPSLREYTRHSRWRNITSYRRIDRGLVSPRLLDRTSAPFVERVVHLRPSDEEMVALRATGSNSKWSDHSAVQLTIRYTPTPTPIRPWKFPAHLLKDPEFVDEQLRPLATAALGDAKTDPASALTTFLQQARDVATREREGRERAHRVHKGRVLKLLRAAHRDVGHEFEPGGGLHAIPDSEPMKRRRIALVSMRRDHLLEEWAGLCRAEQQRWADDHGFEEFVAGESCCKQFFKDKVMSKTYSYIEHVRPGGGVRVTGTRRILSCARRYFCGKGSLFNLQSPPQPQHRNTILSALTEDGRRLTNAQRDDLSLGTIFQPERVQQAIDELQNGTQTGEDGWTAEFCKAVGMRCMRDGETGERDPSALAKLLSRVFVQCASSGEHGTGDMLDMMKTSVVSLIFKDKGERWDLGKYRPIAVNSIIYRIMAKAMVIALRPLLPTLTDYSQKAFKVDDLISDNTRLVQDIMQYCDAANVPGFLVFADQDSAYPRVRWDYMLDVMRTMNIHSDFVSMVETMYSGIRLKFKVNGTVDTTACQPTNGIAQGCPLSPCIYLLCIQGLISMTHLHARRTDGFGIRGIEIPDRMGRTDVPITTIISAFADDICLCLRSAAYLPAFRRDILAVYELGAGALNSWEKTYGWHLGPNAANSALPDGWTEGIDITCSRNKVLRYLGIFMGTDEQIETAWHSRTTTKMSDRVKLWRERGMPGTREGRCVALRNSILATGWYLVENQTPSALSAILEKWRRITWNFFSSNRQTAEDARSLSTTTTVKQLTLIGDYDEGGVRAPDVENFAAALQVHKLRRLLEPHSGPQTNFLLHWIQITYGHLRQGTRLLISTCDFLQLVEPEKIPKAWRYFLKAVGTMRGPVPAVDQADAAPFASYDTLVDAARTTALPRTVNVKARWTIGEVAVEPLFYNPNLNGWFGYFNLDTTEWLRDHRERHSEVHLVRISKAREGRARDMLALSRTFASANITHVCHLLASKEGEILRILTYKEQRERRGGLALPFTKHNYDALVTALPSVWIQTIARAATLQATRPMGGLTSVIRASPHPPGTWIRDARGRVGQMEARPVRILHCFSGRAHRADGLAAALKGKGFECKEVDTLIHDKRHDLLDDTVFDDLCKQAAKGYYSAGVFGVPCSTFSVARIPDPANPNSHTGPMPVRARAPGERLGLASLTVQQRREVNNANLLVERSAHLATLICQSGGAIIFENPPDRANPTSHDSVVRSLYDPKWSSHCPLWLHPVMEAIKHDLDLREVTFSQCMMSSAFQKVTTLWYSDSLAPVLDQLQMCQCTHGSGAHPEVARGKTANNDWMSAEAAAYPARMNEILADAIQHHCEHLPNASVRFTPAVKTWYTVSRAGTLVDAVMNEHVTQRQCTGMAQVHVWTQQNMAHCREEEEWRDRNPELVSKKILWCGGLVVDFNFLTSDTLPNSGATNLGDWTWWHGHMDRDRPPIPICNADVYHIYHALLSYCFVPMRTFDLHHTHTVDGREHTSWVDLLTLDQDDGALDEQRWQISHIVTDDGGTPPHLYKVRWYGYSEDMDTWEPAVRIKHTKAFERYTADTADGVPLCLDCGDPRPPLPDTLGLRRPRIESTHANPHDPTHLRRLIFCLRKQHSLDKRTSDRLYDVWADARRLGPRRCSRRDLHLRGRCIYCILVRRDVRDETTRHAHLDCPFTTLVLDMVYRTAMKLTATNAHTLSEIEALTPHQLTQLHKRALITGLRIHDVSRSVPTPPSQDEPFLNLIAETHASIIHVAHRNDICDSLDSLDFDLQRIYGMVRTRMAAVSRYTYLAACARENRLRILQPKIQLTDANGDDHGPVAEWAQMWVTKGWATSTGRTLLPRRPPLGSNPHGAHRLTRLAWRVPLALDIAFAWITSRSSLSSCRLVARTLPKALSLTVAWLEARTFHSRARRCQNTPRRLASPKTLVIYPDGAYNHAKGGGTQRAGFGVTLVRGGDGMADLDAIEVDCMSGTVTLDPGAPTFLGAPQHTNNTGELTGVMEGILWALNDDPEPETDVLLKPDSEYTMAAATGDYEPAENVEMVRHLRRMYSALLTQRHGRVRWAHVPSHTQHKWNDRADKLAAIGTTLTLATSRVPGERWRRVRLDGHLSPHRAVVATRTKLTITVTCVNDTVVVDVLTANQGAFWRISSGESPGIVQHLRPLQVDSPARVLRCTDEFGTLNLLPVPTTTNTDVSDAAAAILESIDNLVEDTCTVSDAGREAARQKVRAAAQALSTGALRDHVCAHISRNPILPDTELRCPVDISSLTEFVAHPDSDACKTGTTTGVTYRALANRLLTLTKTSLTVNTPAAPADVAYGGLIPVDGHGFWLRKIQYLNVQVWSDFGTDLGSAATTYSVWEQACSAAHSLSSITTGGLSSLCVQGGSTTEPSTHYFCDVTTPPQLLSPETLAVKRFVKFPSRSCLHPRLKSIDATALKRVLTEIKAGGWRTQPLRTQTVSETAYHIAGVLLICKEGMWLHRVTYSGHEVWSDCFVRGRQNEAAWEAATRAAYQHAGVHLDPANGQLVCYRSGHTKHVCYITHMPKDTAHTLTRRGFVCVTALPANLHPRLWRNSPLHAALDECATRGWAVYPGRMQEEMPAAPTTQPDSDRIAWLDLRYGYGTQSQLGRRLVASGHIRLPREYSTSTDPFLGFGKVVKEVAIARFGHDFDDQACYPNVTAATIPIGSQMADLFTTHKNHILLAIGQKYFPDLHAYPQVQRDRAKTLCHRLDNNGTIDGFRREHGLLDNALFHPRTLTIRLPTGEHFNLQTFIEEKAEQTRWLARELPAMHALITAANDRAKPEATLRAFYNQDFEGVSRRAKIRWAALHGQYPFLNQHDGVGIGTDAAHTPDAVARALTEEVSAALGYRQPVEDKPMAHQRPNTEKYRWPTKCDERGAGSQYVHVAPTGEAARLQTLVATALAAGGTATMTIDTIVLADHDTDEATLRQRSSRACSFTIPAPNGSEDVWRSTFMRELCVAVERGHLWVGTPPVPLRPLYDPTEPFRAEMHTPDHHTTHTDPSRDCYADSDTTVSDSPRSASPSGISEFSIEDDDNLDYLRETRPASTSSIRSFAPPSPVPTARHTLPTTQTTTEQSDPIAALRVECMRAERILAGTLNDDGAGVHEDPRDRLLVYQRRLAHLHHCSSELPGEDANSLPSSPPAARPHAPVNTCGPGHGTRTHTRTPSPTALLPPPSLTASLPAPHVRLTRLTRPQPTRAPPHVPLTTPTGYWRVHGFTRAGQETLSFHPHKHTPVTRPRAHAACMYHPADELSAAPAHLVTHPSPATHNTCEHERTHAQADNRNRPHTHSQPAPPGPHTIFMSESARCPPTASVSCPPIPCVPSPVNPRPCASNRNRPSTQSQSPTHPPEPSPAMTTEPQSTPMCSSAFQFALDTMKSMARFAKRVASAALPARDHGTPPEMPMQFVSGKGCDPARSRLPSSPPPRGGGCAGPPS